MSESKKTENKDKTEIKTTVKKTVSDTQPTTTKEVTKVTTTGKGATTAKKPLVSTGKKVGLTAYFTFLATLALVLGLQIWFGGTANSGMPINDPSLSRPQVSQAEQLNNTTPNTNPSNTTTQPNTTNTTNTTNPNSSLSQPQSNIDTYRPSTMQGTMQTDNTMHNTEITHNYSQNYSQNTQSQQNSDSSPNSEDNYVNSQETTRNYYSEQTFNE